MHFSLDFIRKGSYIWITMCSRYETQILDVREKLTNDERNQESRKEGRSEEGRREKEKVTWHSR